MNALRSVAKAIRWVENGIPQKIRHPIIDLRQGLAASAFDLVRGRPGDLHHESFTVHGHSTFFGYYDRTPESAEGDAVLAHAVLSEAPAKAADICVFEHGEHRVISRTDLWSWQLGARLGWISCDGGEAIIFNARHNDSAGAILMDRDGRELSRFAGCVYDHAPDGSFGLGVDMARLGWARPGYGYPALNDATRTARAPDIGVQRIDFTSGALANIAPMCDILQVEPQATFADAFHYLNHVSISPDGKKYIVYHLWLMDPVNTDNFQARVLVGDCEGGWLRLLDDGGRPSHYCWHGPDELIIYRIDQRNNGYRSYNLSEEGSEPFWDFVPVHDGHQSFNPVDPSVFLMDTYADWLSGQQEVHVYHQDGRGGCVLRLRADPRLEGGARCDLHPRWSRDGSGFYLDTSCEGGRQLLRVAAPDLS